MQIRPWHSLRQLKLPFATQAILVAALSLGPVGLPDGRGEIVDDFDELETGPTPKAPPASTIPPVIGGDAPTRSKSAKPRTTPGTNPSSKPGTTPGSRPGRAATPAKATNPIPRPGRVVKVKTAPEGKEKTDRNSPITYKADKVLTFKTKKDYSVLNLVKNVFIRQGRLTLSSQRAKVYLRPSRGEANAIDSITIDGNVQVQKSSALPADRVAARGDRAVFKNAQRTVVLTGNAVVVKGEQVVRGDRIRYDLRSGNITISGAKGTLKPGGLN